MSGLFLLLSRKTVVYNFFYQAMSLTFQLLSIPFTAFVRNRKMSSIAMLRQLALGDGLN
jgi:hypothetical protein